MEHVQEFKCPGCGAMLQFNPSEQNLKCPFCDTEISINEAQFTESETQTNLWEPMSAGDWKEGETQGMRVYACRSCGGEIIADESTGATNCPYCGSQVIMKEQFSGDLRPDYIIPFRHDKEAAKAAYRKHLEGKKFLPPFFKSGAHIDELKGIYVPFWLFDAEIGVDAVYRGEKVRHYTEGEYDCEEIETYQLDRKGVVSYHHVPVDGSSKIDQVLMESIEPFDKKDLVEFQPAYLAGYLADRYDISQDQCIERAQDRMENSSRQAFRSSVADYSSIHVEKEDMTVLHSRYWYALYPVWLLNTSWEGKKYTFAMNGQTGQLIGDLPSDSGSYWKYVGIRTVIIAAVLFILSWIVKLV